MTDKKFSEEDVARITTLMQARAVQEHLKQSDITTIETAKAYIARLVPAVAREYNEGNPTQRKLNRIKMNFVGGLEEGLGLSRHMSSLIVNSVMGHMKEQAEGRGR